MRNPFLTLEFHNLQNVPIKMPAFGRCIKIRSFFWSLWVWAGYLRSRQIHHCDVVHHLGRVGSVGNGQHDQKSYQSFGRTPSVRTILIGGNTGRHRTIHNTDIHYCQQDYYCILLISLYIYMMMMIIILVRICVITII